MHDARGRERERGGGEGERERGGEGERERERAAYSIQLDQFSKGRKKSLDQSTFHCLVWKRESMAGKKKHPRRRIGLTAFTSIVCQWAVFPFTRFFLSYSISILSSPNI